jgi:transposase
LSAGRPLSIEVKGDEVMIVLGADMHKRSHTIAAVVASTGELLGGTTIGVGERGFQEALAWACSLDAERVWALEDCRHVSGSFERFLLAHGERVVRVATRLMASERRGGRQRGKSDRIDALAVARAALREGVERLPVAQLAGVELDIRLLVDHRERLVRMRTAIYNDLPWHLHDLWPEQTFPGLRAAVQEVGHPDRAAPGTRRADSKGPHRPRRARPPARAVADHRPARVRDR